MIFGKKDSGDTAGLEARVKELEAQNETMRSALEFYADVKNWEGGHKYTDDDDATIFTDGSESGATVDKGSRAYRVLKACKS
jgi:predicted enzyme related to lactoylglutathione lyase